MLNRQNRLLAGTVLLLCSNIAHALPTSTFTGHYEFYDENGNLTFTDNNLWGRFDIDNAQGYFDSSIEFEGDMWHADVAEMIPWTGIPGSGTVEYKNFSWMTQTWQVNGNEFECRVSKEIDGCAQYRQSGGTLVSSVENAYEFALTEGQFAGGVFLDWGEYIDIPILSAMQVISFDGNIMRVGSIDTDHDGIPGTALLESPFTGVTWSFDGQQEFDSVSSVPLPPAIWLFLTGLSSFLYLGSGRKA